MKHFHFYQLITGVSFFATLLFAFPNTIQLLITAELQTPINPPEYVPPKFEPINLQFDKFAVPETLPIKAPAFVMEVCELPMKTQPFIVTSPLAVLTKLVPPMDKTPKS